jgi:hypothetical protein
MGILYKGDDSEEGTQNPETDSVSCGALAVEQSTPAFILRTAKSRRSRRRSTWRSLPLYLSLSNLRDDIDIARLLSPPLSHNPPTIQHREISIPSSPIVAPITTVEIPLSLPTTSALGSPASAHGSQHLLDNTLTIPSHSLENGDWTFITTAHHTPNTQSPSSEPETWILLSDDS